MLGSPVTTGLVLAHGGDGVPPPLANQVFTAWAFAPVPTALLAASAALYLVGVGRVAARHPTHPWPWPRTASFFAGLAIIVVALMSCVGVYDDTLFWIHMVQHLLLIMVAPAFLLAGKPATLLLHAAHNPLHRWARKVLRSPPVSAVTHPLVAAAVYGVVIVVTHLTRFMNLVLVNETIHQGEHALYLVSGYLFFLPIFGREPIRWRISYPAKLGMLLVAMTVDTFVGVMLMEMPAMPWPAYAAVGRTWGPSLVTDLHWGGATMWVGGDFIMFVLAVAVFLAWGADRRHPFSIGPLLEGIRADTLATQVRAVTGQQSATPHNGATIDDDEQELAAYNAMLARLHDRSTRNAHPPPTHEQ